MWAEPKPDLKVGDWVEVRGVVEWLDFAPDIGSPRFRVLGRAPLPTAPGASFSQLTSTNNNSRRVQVEGVVLDVTKQGEQLRLTLEVDGGTVNVWIPHVPDPAPANLVDARVRVQGVCGATFNKKNQLIAVRLYVPSLRTCKVIEEGPGDPFAGPVHSISSLLRFVPKQEPGRVRYGASSRFSKLDGASSFRTGTMGFMLKASREPVSKSGTTLRWRDSRA